MACMYAALSTNGEGGYVKTYPGAEGEERHVLGNLPISAIERGGERLAYVSCY